MRYLKKDQWFIGPFILLFIKIVLELKYRLVYLSFYSFKINPYFFNNAKYIKDNKHPANPYIASIISFVFITLKNNSYIKFPKIKLIPNAITYRNLTSNKIII